MKRPDLQELGATGLPHYGGRVYDEHLPELTGGRWARVARRMMNDSTVTAVLFSIEMLARQVTWTFEAAGERRDEKKAAEFFRGALFEDMSQTWADTLSDILSFLAWGWSYPEIVYKTRQGDARDPSKRSRFTDGKVGWRKWASRAQETLDRWEFDEGGGVRAMVQQPPPDFRDRVIPIEKGLLFRTSAHKNNPQPPGILRRAYRPWYMKTRIENIEGVGIERDLAGLPVAWVPAEIMSSTASDADKAIYAKCQEIVTQIRRDEQEGIVWPLSYNEAGHKEYDLTLLTSGGKRQHDTGQIVERYSTAIAMTVLADFLMLGHQQAGTFALSTDKTEMFSVAMGAFLDSVCDVVNRHAVPRLGALNGMKPEQLPKLKRGEVEAPNLKDLGEYISKLSAARIEFTPKQVAHLKRQIKGMPVEEKEEQHLQDKPAGDQGGQQQKEQKEQEENAA